MRYRCPDTEETAAAGAYGLRLDEPPPGTEPVARPAQLCPLHRVVAYVAGRWRDALLVSRDQRSALVAYVADGLFGARLGRG